MILHPSKTKLIASCILPYINPLSIIECVYGPLLTEDLLRCLWSRTLSVCFPSPRT